MENSLKKIQVNDISKVSTDTKTVESTSFFYEIITSKFLVPPNIFDLKKKFKLVGGTKSGDFRYSIPL